MRSRAWACSLQDLSEQLSRGTLRKEHLVLEHYNERRKLRDALASLGHVFTVCVE